MENILTATAPFSFQQSWRFIDAFKPMAGDLTLGAGRIAKAFMHAGQAYAVEIAAAGTPEAPAVCVSSPAQVPAAVLDQIRFWLSLDDDLRPFYEVARTDGLFWPTAQKVFGLHQVKFPSPFELACWAVLTQRNALPGARTMKRALVQHYGKSVALDGMTHWAFPEAAEMAGATAETLQELIGHPQKARYLANVVAAFNAVEVEWMRSAPYDQVRQWLLSIKGIGPFSALFVMLRGLGRVDRLTLDTDELRTAAARVYNAGKPLPDAEIYALAERYGDYRGYWAYYLRQAS